MAEIIIKKNCVIRRIDFEPKNDYLGDRTYAHVFFLPEGEIQEIDAYTEDPRFESALLRGFDPVAEKPPRVELHYVELDPNVNKNKILRVILDRGFNSQ